ncbi:MAG: FAD-dependent oxidoreductase [Planctomycetaceae bacterium]|nr:FAD-dependent oxidoreductase [Planctomycetaceae bacterium]
MTSSLQSAIRTTLFTAILPVSLLLNLSACTAETFDADLIVYGGTSSGVVAAVQARRMGMSVILVGPDRHLGGLTSGGLGFTDTGNKAVIGGLSREFYHRVWKEYQKPDAWRWQKQSEYGNKGQGTPAIDGENRTMWIFEPHIAEQVFESFVQDENIPVHRDEWLDRERGVSKVGNRIASITMLSGRTYTGRMFLDATYEGDLMAAAGVDYHVGREANSVYDENWNGVQTGVLHHRHHFGAVKQKISPYRTPGDPSSGVLPRISTEPPGEYGSGDHRVQAYCYRYCATDHPENRVPFPRPAGYDPAQYELLVRIYEAGWRETFSKFDPIPNHKTDTNNHGPFSTDNIGMNYDYPEATYERRREILDEHRRYQQGWLYFVANDPRVPTDVRARMQRWGLPQDEFTDNGNWPHQIYVREARRMIGRFVMTENELTRKKPTPESVGMGSYTIDSHNVQRYITPDGSVQNEGDIGVAISPYAISYGSLVPRKSQCQNLLVSVCVSSSHIAFGSIRMEPVFMILGQSAATAAALAVKNDIAVQDVDYKELKARLLSDGQVLEYAGAPGGQAHGAREFVDPQKLPGIVVDDDKATLTGEWKISSASHWYVSSGYRHDNDVRDADTSARFETQLPKAGRYEVRISWPPNANRSSRTRVEVHSGAAVTAVIVDQRKAPQGEDHFESLGCFEFAADTPAVVVVSSAGADGYVVIDAVQWQPESN